MEMPVVVVRENIISLHADAVVNPATPSLTAGEGISAEIFAAAGQRKLAAAHCEPHNERSCGEGIFSELRH